MTTENLSDTPIEIKSSKELARVVVRHLNDTEFLFKPAVAIQGTTGTVYITPGQLSPLINALIQTMEEAV